MDATSLANNSQHCWMLHVECNCTPFKDGMSLWNGIKVGRRQGDGDKDGDGLPSP